MTVHGLFPHLKSRLRSIFKWQFKDLKSNLATHNLVSVKCYKLGRRFMKFKDSIFYLKCMEARNMNMISFYIWLETNCRTTRILDS